MKRVLLIIGAPILVVSLGAPFHAICDGSYDLTVEITTESAARATGISFVGVRNLETADAVVADVDGSRPEMERRSPVEPFSVSVGFSYKASPFGFTWGHVQQYAYIVVVLDRDDGSRAVHVVPVPHRNASKRIVVGAGNVRKETGGLVSGETTFFALRDGSEPK